MGDPDATSIQKTNWLINTLDKEIKGRQLKTIILVKKSTDFLVMADFAWYLIYLKTILDKEQFDMTKIIIVNTFSDVKPVDDASMKRYIDKLWKATGFEA